MFAKLRSRLARGRQRLAPVARFVRREDGAAALEFALVSVPFIGLLLATLQTSLVFFAGQVLESAAADSSRLILTGTAQNSKMKQGDFASAVCGKFQALFNCSGLMIDVQTASSFANANTSLPTLSYDAQGNVSNSWAYQPGNKGDIVIMRVMYLWPVFTGPLNLNLSNQGNGKLLLIATAAFRNEPF
jgi:Flp pilus assembly protein TadG